VYQMRVQAPVLEQLHEPAQPNAASDATGFPAGRWPISRSIGSDPLTTFLLSSTVPFSVTTATWERLRARLCRRKQTLPGLLSRARNLYLERPATGLSWEGAPALIGS
jgi:hypothetical protein